MAGTKRTGLYVSLYDKELEMLDKLNEHEGESRSALIRRMIRRAYKRIFEPTTTRATMVFPRNE